MNFTDTLAKKPDEIEKPPLMPAGNYVWAVEKIPSINSENENWEIVEYSVKCVRPADDMDPDAVSEFIAKAGALNTQRNRVAFLFDRADLGKQKVTEFQHKRFLTEVLKCWEPDETLKQGMARAVNAQFIAAVVWKKDRNDDSLYHANLGKTAPLD